MLKAFLKTVIKNDKISERREEYQLKTVMQKPKNNAKTGVIPQKDLNISVSTGFRMYSGTLDDYYLNDINYLNIKQKLAYNYLEASVSEYWGGDNSGVDNSLNFVFV